MSPRGGGRHRDDTEARQDSMRDVLGLYRAALNGDGLGMRVIFTSTRCLSCLAGGAVQVGLWLAAREDDDITCDGEFAEAFAAEVRDLLDVLQVDGEIHGDHDG
jgi:hypothetical protein